MPLPALLVLCVAFIASSASAKKSGRLNQLQVLHWHNTYHTCPGDWLHALAESALGGQVVNELFPGEGINALQYNGPSTLTQALGEYGARSIELDVAWDPKGGRYQYRAGPKFAGALTQTNYSADVVGSKELSTRGWKTMHLPDFDPDSTCTTLEGCLDEVKAWVDENPDHHPIFLNIECKEHKPKESFGVLYDAGNILLGSIPGEPTSFAETPDPDVEQMEELEKALEDAFGESLYTPDDLRGKYHNLRNRLEKKGFPPISSLVGKVIPILVGSFTHQRFYESMYNRTHGATFFIEKYPDAGLDENTVFVQMKGNMNDVEGSISNCKKLVNNGYLLRMADAGTRMIDEGMADVRDMMIECGAHFLHTDYPGGWTATKSACGLESDFTVTLTSNMTGNELATACNPQTSHKQCFGKKVCICEEGK